MATVRSILFILFGASLVAWLCYQLSTGNWAWTWGRFVGIGIGCVIALVGIGLLWMDARFAEQRNTKRPGFEVNLTAGKTPVLLKEDNHG
jgi:uncharacterized membrane protein YccC